MPCTIQVNDVFGPAVSSTCHYGFDFTLLFEEVFLCIVPIVVLTFLVPIRLYQLLPRRPVFSPGNFYYTKLALHICFIIIQLVKLIFLVIPGYVPKTRASIAAQALSFYIAIVLCGLSHFEHLRSVRPSALLSLYFGVSLLLDTVRARTLWTLQNNVPFAVAFSVSLGFQLALFIFESLEKETGYNRSYETLSKETAGNVFTRSLFWWVNPLLLRGFKQVLEIDQLPQMDNELSSPALQRKIWADWSALPAKSPAALFKLLLKEYRYSLFQGMIPRAALSGFTFAQPFLITRVVNFAVDDAVRLDHELGNGLIAATALIYIGLAVSNANTQHKTYRVITRLRASLVSLIYYKTLSVSIPTAQDSSAITLMSTDVERSGTGLRFIHELWASPIDIGLSIYLLERQLGPASAAPGVFFILCSAAGLKVAASMGERQRLWLQSIERRIKATSEMLSSMKEVRMGGLQARLEAELRDLRQKEIESSRKFKNALALIVCLSYTTAVMAPVFSFGIFSLLAQKNGTAPLTTDKGFTSLAVFSLLRGPMATLIDAIAGLVASIGAMQRIGEYLTTESHRDPHGHAMPPSPPPYTPYYPDGPEQGYDAVPLRELGNATSKSGVASDRPLVVATNYSAGWAQDKACVLHDLNFSVMSSSLTLIVGPVGCGKSTLLHAMLGETTVNQGSLTRTFYQAAFASQSPWLVSDTIQKNITGTSMFEEAWYNQVVDACALRDDLDRMPKGDQEPVDAGGSNLSGGQQARVGVARAVYSKQPLILLDDVMSGLDARTENSIFTNLLGPEGLLRKQKTTVIYATNALHRLSAGDHILVLGNDGRLVEQGTYSELTSMEKLAQSGDREPSEFVNVSVEPVDAEMRGLLQTLTTKEVVGNQRRTGDLTVYKYYAQVVGYLNFAIFIALASLFVFALVFPQYIVKWWAQENQRHPNKNLGYYLGGYFALGWVALFALGSACLQLVVRMMPKASSTFHTVLLRTTLDAPLSLFAGNNLGDTINRFSQDLQLIDMELPLALFNTIVELLSCIAQIILIAISAKYIGAAMPAVLVAFFLIQTFYLRTARQLRLLDIEAKGPLFSSFLETLSGLATIRAFGWESEYEQRCQEKLDWSQRPNYLLYCVQRWLNLVLDFVVAGIAIVVITIATKTKGDIDPGLIGVALVNIINFSVSIKALLENWTTLETSIGAVSRIRSFAKDTPSEHKTTEKNNPPPNWPAEGHVAWDHITATWEGKSAPVLEDLFLTVEPGQKLAICGRSGSGKSSLVSALFRLLEPQQGTILIDDVDISTIPRQDVRQRLICVTQAPFLLSASIRDNVDPFKAASDDDILHALAEVQMQEVVDELGGLDALVNGDKMSVGQKQLICLARATLRPGSILVLDEATASLDLATDEQVQKIIRTAFRNHTVITIAHRLQTIVDYDHIAVISDGKLAEYGPPARLLENESSYFAQLYRASAGHTKIERAKSKARSVYRSRSSSKEVIPRLGSLRLPPPLEKTFQDTLDYTASSRRNRDMEGDDDAAFAAASSDYFEGFHEESHEGEQPLISSTIQDVARTFDDPIFSFASQNWTISALTRPSGLMSTPYAGVARLDTVRKQQLERQRRDRECRREQELARSADLDVWADQEGEGSGSSIQEDNDHDQDPHDHHD
ncbi:hypothetical protein A1O1_05954 [Capronia coronata CBS 617.96]|uniref:ATPase n=1 Tax=Capronia coronata CBS 617.96 TaxID=1182541 RepID=W9YTH4_9EURO|nr:uncharacterized protein A1O1_05954 [Capronia coronata CBS 617.96]EXJ85589.1 hypothetical protein A1O1_05954 [Capronia coronata CBS 617.96]